METPSINDYLLYRYDANQRDRILATYHTPRKNRTILNYPDFLERQWRFEAESDDEGAEDKEEDDDMVDVVHIGGRMVLRAASHCGRPT